MKPEIGQMPTALPVQVVAYKRTPVFDENTLPDGLRRGHNTKAGVWGVIHILKGKLLYRTLDPLHEIIADVSTPSIIIKPQTLHEVSPVGAVLFYVEFHKDPASEKTQ